ncbi:MAG: TIR domain-containing protein [Pseudomonadota bacterium]
MKSKYDAFISYRHASESNFAAEFEVHVKRYAKSPLQRPRRIFRDEQHIRPGYDLSQTIQDALEGSSHLVLLASPDSADSDWVRKEIDVWCGDLARVEQLIIVLTSGVIALSEDGQTINWSETTALPPNLKPYLSGLPLWLDMRSFKADTTQSLSDPVYRAGVNAIVARLEDQDPNQLSGVEWKLRRRNQRVAWSAASIMAILLAASVYSAVGLFRSNANLEQALKVSQSREYAATSRLQNMPIAMKSAMSAVRSEPTREAVRALLDVMSDNRALRGHIAKATEAVQTLAVSEDRSTFFYPDLQRSDPGIVVIGKDGTHHGVIPLPGAERVWDLSILDPTLYVLTDDGVWTAHMDCMCAAPLFNDFEGLFPTKLEAMDGQLIMGGADGRVFRLILEDLSLTLVDNLEAAIADISSHKGMFAVAATKTDRAVKIWLDPGMPPKIPDELGERAVNALAFSPDGRYLAAAFERWGVALWSIPDLTLLWDSPLEENGASVAFSPDGTLLAAGTSAGDIDIFNFDWGDREDRFSAVVGGVWELAWLESGLLSAGSDGWLKLWDPVTPGVLATALPSANKWTVWNDQLIGLNDDHLLFPNDSDPERLNWELGDVMTASHNRIVSQRDGEIIVHQITPDRNVDTRRFPSPPEGYRPRSVSFSPDGRSMAISWWPLTFGEQIGKVAVWRLDTDDVVWMEQTVLAPRAMAFSNEGKLAITAEGMVAIHDAATGQLLHGGETLIGQAPIQELAFSGEDTLYAGGLMGTIQRLSLAEGVSVTTSSGIPVGAVRDVNVLEDGSIVQVDVDGVRWFDPDLNYRGPLLTTDGRQISAWRTIEFDRQGDPHLLVEMQAGHAVLVNLDIEAWLVEADRRSHYSGDGSDQIP